MSKYDRDEMRDVFYKQLKDVSAEGINSTAQANHLLAFIATMLIEISLDIKDIKHN